MSNAQMHSPVVMKSVSIAYGGLTAVDDVSMDIRSGEFFTLLGPSGCGKTTLLRAIAGFNRQTGGSITIGDVVVDDLPAHRRNTGMVFQNYAIFPHLTVWDNVAYGLKSRRVAADELAERVREALAMVDLTGYEKRMPKQLSGGQQQRVVIARAIVIRPRVLLMDEPLANLDAKLRVRLREDLRQLQQRLGITTVYVTHDQEEALSISDRIAVMSKGRVLQIGTPEEVYAAPAHVAVARFVGEGTFLRARLVATGAREVELAGGRRLGVGANTVKAGKVLVGFRPHDLRLAEPGPASVFSGQVASRAYFGPFVQLIVEAGLEVPVIARIPVTPGALAIAAGDTIGLAIDAQSIAVFPDSETIDA
jgi:ABC-type Fe3+/spermidine/putrescine transport system ATPase subunit